MERLYRKQGEGKATRYVEAGYQYSPDLYDGVWLVTSQPGSTSTKGVAYRISDVPNPVELGISAALIASFEEELTNMVAAIFNQTKTEGDGRFSFKREYPLTESEKKFRDKDPLVYNISYYDLVQLFVSKIDSILQDMRKRARRINPKINRTASWLLTEDFKNNWRKRYVIPPNPDLDLREQDEKVRKSILAFYWACAMDLSIDLPTDIIYQCGYSPSDIDDRMMDKEAITLEFPWQNR